MSFEELRQLEHDLRLREYPTDLVELCKDTRFVSLILYDTLICNYYKCHEAIDFHAIYSKLNYFQLKNEFPFYISHDFIDIAFSLTRADLKGLLRALSLCKYGHYVMFALKITSIDVLVEFSYGIATGSIQVYCTRSSHSPSSYTIALPIKRSTLDAFLVRIAYVARAYGLDYMPLVEALFTYNLSVNHFFLMKLIENYQQFRRVLTPGLSENTKVLMGHYLEYNLRRLSDAEREKLLALLKLI